MKQIVILFAAFGFFQAKAQNTNSGKVSGLVIAQQKAIEAANVSLLKAKDSSLVKAAITNKLGEFEIASVKEGNYLLFVQAVGYQKFYSAPFVINEQNNQFNVKANMQSVSAELGGVTVVSKKPFIEQKLDKMVVNVDASPTNAGLTVLELLEKSPGVMVDKDGNISLKGKQGVNILIDGRPTYLSGQDLANMLKNMPSANLDVLEIMTNPPAKYDAAGNAGVINIKTKKNKVKGFNGSVSTGYIQGIYPRNNNSVNLNYRSGKFNFFGNAAVNYREGFQNLSLIRNFRDKQSNQIISTFDQLSVGKRKYNSHSYKFGMDYFLSKKTTFGFVVNGYGETGNEYSANTTFIRDHSATLQTRTQATNEMLLSFRNVGANLNLRHVIDSTGKELTADIDYVHYNSSNRQFMDNYFFDGLGNKKSPDELLKGYLPSAIDIYSAKVDYLHPLKGEARFEAGIKSSYVKTDNNAIYENWDGANWALDAGRSNHFIYSENINAAYANVNKKFNAKWSAQLGLRIENTIAKGNQLTTGTQFNRNYTQLFPTTYIGYTLNKNNQFSLNYGRRIQRPSYQDMNPFYYFIDKYTYEVGNPYLIPQFTHNIELIHTFKGFLNTTIGYSDTKNVIEQILDQVDSTTTTFIKRDNIARQQNLSLTVNAGIPVTKWWNANIYASLVNNIFSGNINNEQLSFSSPTFLTNITNQFSFKNGWSAEVGGFYRTSGIDGVLMINPLGAVNMGVSKQVMKGKGTVRLSIRDIFYTQPASGFSRYQNIDVKFKEVRDTRNIGINFTYRFGKGKPVQQRKRGGAGEEQSRVNGGGSN